VEDCENHDPLLFCDEKDCVRKPPKQYSADLAVHGLIVLRIPMCLLDRLVKLSYETAPEAVEL
jgi:hypothetical protein